MSKRILAILLALLMAPFFSGCYKPVADNSQSDDSAKTEADSLSVPQKDVATQPNTLPEKDSTASEVCERFQSLLAHGERTLAEQLLTQRAFKVTVEAGLELEAMGGPEASVDVGKAIYATSQAKVAQVPCTIVEKDGASQTLTWMMRRGESGWRIAGLVLESDKSPELLSLENKADVLQMIGSENETQTAAVDPVTEGEVRLVSGTDDE